MYPGYNAAVAAGTQTNCLADGEASLPVRAELANGQTFTSAPGYGIVYNSLDNTKNPTNGIYFNFGQDFAGAGGDTAYIKSIVEIPHLLRGRVRSRRHRTFAGRQYARLQRLSVEFCLCRRQ